MKISIGSDHAGYALKTNIIKYLENQRISVLDCGCFSEDRADYPDYGHAVAENVISGDSDYGIIICGSGNGINMAANKHTGIRSALCWNTEIARLAKEHNDANIIALPARFISVDDAEKCIDVFIKSKFEGGRHAERIKKINC